MKIKKSTIKRLMRIIVRGNQPIKTKEWARTSYGHAGRVHLIPTSSIVRSQYAGSYNETRGRTRVGTVNIKTGRDKTIWVQHPSMSGDSEVVKSLRRAIRRGKSHELPPIQVRKSPHSKKKEHFLFHLDDGHHRLTAHQAEGKRFIRAIIMTPRRLKNIHREVEHRREFS